LKKRLRFRIFAWNHFDSSQQTTSIHDAPRCPRL
jgi:hypothetical protein